MRNTWAVEHPIGNPFDDTSRHSNRQLHAPAAAIFATAAGTFTAASVLGGIAMVGTALSVVGMVTGNAGLAKIGGAMGLIGGLGGLAANAFSSAGAAVGEGATAAMAEGSAATAGQTIGDNVAASLSTGAQAADGVAGSFSNMLTDSAASGLAGEAGSNLLGQTALESSIDSGILGGAVEGVSNSAAPGLGGVAEQIYGAEPGGYGQSMWDSATPGMPSANPAGAMNGFDAQELNPAHAMRGAEQGILEKAGSGISGFFKDNKELLKVGGQMLSGASQQKSQEDMMKMQMEYRTALQNNDYARADELRRQYNASVSGTRINMRATGAPVNPTGMSLGQTSGIIPRAWNQTRTAG